jgi:hypothetical protein
MIGFIVTMVLFAATVLTSCTTTKVVTVEKVRNDTTIITKWQRDSVWLHDSVTVREKGDTVLMEKWHTKYIEKQIHDTTYVAKHDTIPQPYPVEKKVPAELSWWQRLRIILGNFVILAVIAIAGYWVWRLWRVYKFF